MQMFLCSATLGDFTNDAGERVEFARVGLTDMQSTQEFSVDRPIAQTAQMLLDGASKPVPVDVEITIGRNSRARVVGLKSLK